MAAKLGANDVAVRLGNQAASVYLGAVEVYAPVVALYFNGAASSDWSDSSNWWLNSGHTVAADYPPTAEDSVIATASIENLSEGSDPTVLNLTLNGTGGGSPTLGIFINVGGMATFNDNSVCLVGVGGNCTFNDNSSAGLGAIIVGDATFNDNSENLGEVTGTATFTGSACNDGGVASTFVPDPPPSC